VRDLFAARLEAFAIQQALYRGARYVGRRPNGSVSPSGTGSVAEVTAWLGESGRAADTAEDEARRRRRLHAAGSWLHLACHGYVGPSEEATAYLLLADDVLRAEELVALMARAPERQIGLVVLAACCTAQSLSSYDEAYSLGTTFLAGGARSVLSTLWEVSDTSTSALMFMFHHFVRVERLAPWAALRRAQLWMLDPKRQLPAEMPSQLLAHLRTDELDRVVAWAGFVHWGQ
jgi:CHAT domain-containing protein